MGAQPPLAGLASAVSKWFTTDGIARKYTYQRAHEHVSGMVEARTVSSLMRRRGGPPYEPTFIKIFRDGTIVYRVLAERCCEAGTYWNVSGRRATGPSA